MEELFKLIQGMNVALQDNAEENSRNLEEKLHENARNLQQKFLENSKIVEEQFLKNSRKIEVIEEKLEKTITEFERRMDLIRERFTGHNTTDESSEIISNGGRADSYLGRQRGITQELPTGMITTIGAKIKVPIYDGEIPWEVYKTQFEAAARTNGWLMAEKAAALVELL